jgi:predicted nicotinamide N-methyase
MLALSVIWAVLATAVAALIVARKVAARNEDDIVHVNAVQTNAKQNAVAHNLDIIDRWGVTLTVIVVVYGLALMSLFLYNSWVQGQQIHIQ